MEKQLISAVVKAVSELYGQEVPESMVQLQKTKAGFEGNLTVVVFPFLKMSRKKPDLTAQEMGEWLAKNCPLVEGFNAVGGFLNLVLSQAVWADMLLKIISKLKEWVATAL